MSGNQTWKINAKETIVGAAFSSLIATPPFNGKVPPCLFSIQLPHGKAMSSIFCRSICKWKRSRTLCSLIWELLILQVEGFLSADGCSSTGIAATASWRDNNSLFFSPFKKISSPLTHTLTWKAKLSSWSAGRAPVSLASVGLLLPDPDCKNDWRQAPSRPLLPLCQDIDWLAEIADETNKILKRRGRCLC